MKIVVLPDECDNEGVGVVGRMMGNGSTLLQNSHIPQLMSSGRVDTNSGTSQCPTSLGQGYAGDMCNYGPVYAAYNYGGMKTRPGPYSRSSPVYPPPYPPGSGQINHQIYRQPPTYPDYSAR